MSDEYDGRGHLAALGNAGGFLTVTTNGIDNKEQTWEFGWVTQAIKAKFEAWVQSRALQMLTRIKQQADSVMYRDQMSTYQADFLSGEYSWAVRRVKNGDSLGSHIWAAMQTDEGSRYLIYLLLASRHKEMTIPLADAICDEQWDWVILTYGMIFNHPNSETSPGLASRAAEKMDSSLTAKREAQWAEQLRTHLPAKTV